MDDLKYSNRPWSCTQALSLERIGTTGIGRDENRHDPKPLVWGEREWRTPVCGRGENVGLSTPAFWGMGEIGELPQPQRREQAWGGCEEAEGDGRRNRRTGGR